MLYGVKLSARKLHAINDVPYAAKRRRNPDRLTKTDHPSIRASTTEDMKRLEEKVFGRRLF